MVKLIEYKNVSVKISQNKVLENINIDVYSNQFVFLVGKIGSGKTTFLRSIYAQIPINYGSAYVLGYNLRKIKRADIPFLRRKIGFIFQENKFLEDRNIYENLKFVLLATGWTDEVKINKKIDEVLDYVGQKDKKNSFPQELSGGELQSISVARALMNNPQLILADEPTQNLDNGSAMNVLKLISSVLSEKTAIIFVTHNTDLIKLYEKPIIYEIEQKTLRRVN